MHGWPGEPPDDDARALLDELRHAEERLEDKALDILTRKRLEQSEKELRARIARLPARPGFVRTPAGEVEPQAKLDRIFTEHRKPTPSFATREAERERYEIDAGVLAESVAKSPSSKHARMLAARFASMAERLDDRETGDERRREIGDAVDRAWFAIANLKEDSTRRLFLVECIEICAAGGAPVEEVRRCFASEYAEDAAKLELLELSAILEVWTPLLGRPPARVAGPARDKKAKWDYVAELCGRLGFGRVSADTLQREWEKHREDWVAKFKDEMAELRSEQTANPERVAAARDIVDHAIERDRSAWYAKFQIGRDDKE